MTYLLRLKKMPYILMVLFLLLTGCISEFLPPCPEPEPPIPPERTGKLWIQPSFTMHTQKGDDGEYEELFPRTSYRLDIYIFNAENGILDKVITDQPASFPAGYRLLPELSAGSYEAIAWVNLNDEDATLLWPDTPQTGITTLAEMQVRLAEARNITRQPAPQLWGRSASFTITTEGFEQDTVVPVRLIRDTNKIDFTINWRDKDTGQLCPLQMHADSTRIYIDDVNSSIALADNSLASTDSVTYQALYTSKNEPSLKANFTVMRLLTASAPVLRITRLQADGSEREVYRKDLMKDFISQAYTTQEALDREALFEIMIEFECEHIEKPVEPDKPVDPENPDQPVDPDLPVDPVDPDQPVDPDRPDPPTPPVKNETWLAVRILINGWTLVDDVGVDL